MRSLKSSCWNVLFKLHNIDDFIDELPCDLKDFYNNILKVDKNADNLIDDAAKENLLDVVKYLHEIGKDCTTWAMNLASQNGHLETVKYLHEIVKYLHEIGKCSNICKYCNKSSLFMFTS